MSKEGDILVDSGLAMVIMLMAMWGVEWLGEVAVREVVSILMIAGIVLVALQLVEIFHWRLMWRGRVVY